MKTLHSRSLRVALLAAVAWMVLPATGFAAPDCSPYSSAVAMSWPADNPVWEFCWRRPSASAPNPNGSGVELFDVTYNGHLVFDRLNVPILNVEYGPGGCGCFRDWLDQEVRFEAVGLPCGSGYCEVIQPTRTVCDCAPDDSCDTNPNNACNVDVGSFTGVAAEKAADRLIMTSQTSAGWYRYAIKYSFYLDGSIEPEFGFSSTPNGCTDTTHFHHGYFRFDFDIDGPEGDQAFLERRPEAGVDSDADGVEDRDDNCINVENADQRDSDGDGYGSLCDGDLDNDGVVNFVDLGIMKEAFFSADANADMNGDGSVNFVDLGLQKAFFFGPPGPSGLIPQEELVTTETGNYAGDVVSWLFQDSQTGRGYRIQPGALDHDLENRTFDPAPFAKGDYWVLAAKSNELDDNTFGCSATLDDFVDGENTDNADILAWYRFGDLHEGLDECQCGRVGPRLVPVGNWSPAR